MNDNEVRLPLHALHFRALKPFSHGEEPNRSEYIPGLWYTVRPGDEDLLQRVMQWEKEGAVEIKERPEAKVKGVMRVI